MKLFGFDVTPGFMKGNINILLEKTGFSYGEKIRGDVRLAVKEPLHGTCVSITLIGEQTNTKYVNNRPQSKNVKVFEYKKVLDGEKEYKGEQNYSFELDTPKGPLTQGATFSLGPLTVSPGSGPVRWYLIASLEEKGLDISKKTQIALL